MLSRASHEAILSAAERYFAITLMPRAQAQQVNSSIYTPLQPRRHAVRRAKMEARRRMGF